MRRRLAAGVERPPQFIVMAFDNCTELERWQELTDFAAEMNKDGDKLHFTFFVSGINFIADANRKVYEGPHQPRGASRINFGGTPADVARRVDYVNALHARRPRDRLACGRPFQRRVLVGRRVGARNSAPGAGSS